MSTRWQIAAKLSDGGSACIYVHCDGYPEHALTTLQQHYTDQQKIDRLIGLGDCLSVGDEIEKCDTFHSRDEPWEDVCPTYGDDLKAVANKHRHGDETFVDSGLELAKGARLFGVAFEDMTRDELIAAAANGWNAYTDHLESSIRRSELM